MTKCVRLLIVVLSLTLSAGVEADVLTNEFDVETGVNAYYGDLSDDNWVGPFAGVIPNAGSQFFASANGNTSGSFQGIGLNKAIGGTIQNQTYEVSFFITKYTDNPALNLSGIEFADFSTLRIGGIGGAMSWRSTPTPISNGVWLEWVGSYTPSVTDIGAPFRFIAVFNLDALHSIGIDGPVIAAPPGHTVTIDIKPGSFPNSINPRSKGVIPVAILTTDSLDATTVDPTTVLFGVTGTEAAPAHSALEDVDGDGDTDMILHFDTQTTGLRCGDTSASLTGETLSGQMIEGSDSIKMACPPRLVGV